LKKEGGALIRVVWLLLVATGTAIGLVGWNVFQASQDVSVQDGLDYGVFLRALDDLIEGAGDSTLVRFDEVETVLPGARSVVFDTMVIVADLERFPAFRPAAFLHGQVASYNRFQRERAAVAHIDPQWFGRLEAFNPSVFRSRERDFGGRTLTRAPAAWNLRVRSPFDGEWNGELRARDVHRGRGLVGTGTMVPLHKSVQLIREVDSRAQVCEFLPLPPFDVQVFCLSEERMPQAILRFPSEERASGYALAGWTDLWADGVRARPGDSVQIREGTVLRINPLEPILFGDYWEGVLSSKQWISGRMRRQGSPSPPLDLFSPLGTRGVAPGQDVAPNSSIPLSVDAGASLELTGLLRTFLEEEVDLPLDFGLAVLARIPDGEILALAEVGQRRHPGRSNLLERLAPGSVVKPLLAAAILSQRPELASLEIPARTGAVSSILGLPSVPSRRAFSTSLNCTPPSDGWLDLRYFLRCSNNEYAASLLTAGLSDPERQILPSGAATGRALFSLAGLRSGKAWTGLTLQDGRVPRSTLLRSPLSAGLLGLFDLPADPLIADSLGRSRRIWEGLRFSDGNPVRVPFELLPSQSRPALLSPSSRDGTELGLLYRYSYGAWENQWTILDLTNAFARIVSDRRMQLTFARRVATGAGTVPSMDWDSASPPEDHLGLSSQGWYEELMGGLQAVARDGTARGLQGTWRRQGLPGLVLAKTGTLAEAGEPGPRDDLYTKSLLFAVGESAHAPGQPLACGVVGGIYLRFREGPRSGNLASYQVTFVMDRLGRFLEAHWEGFRVCSDRGI
jgi:hypothetical protein